MLKIIIDILLPAYYFTTMNPIYDYIDYRKYLDDYYAFKKATVRGFSHRFFLQKAGLKGPNFLKNVIDGKKNLSQSSIDKFAKALALAKREHEYFKLLVLFNQSSNPVHKHEIFAQLSAFPQKSQIQQINNDNFEYLSKWYIVAVREFINSKIFTGDCTELTGAIYPKITLPQAKQALRVLKRLKMVEQDEAGVYHLADKVVSTGTEVNEIGAHSHHKAMIDISKKAIDAFQSKDRYYRSITGSFSEEAFQKIKMQLDVTRKKVLEIIADDTNPNGIFQLNMQFFPLTLAKKKRGTAA
ncbi:MAG: TIGR02147 family protein [Chitinivibrionales bacterium]|nr:TIGR02147 family protein [Chitinivibrionales bacterium]